MKSSKDHFMRILIIFILAQMTILVIGRSQHSNQIIVNDPDNLEKISKGGGGFYGASPAYDGIEGTPYVFQWSQVSIYIGGKKSTRGYLASYDASRNVIDVRDNNRVFELDSRKIDSLVYENRKFVHIDRIGYVEVLNTGKYFFFKKHSAVVKRPTYVAALDTGSRSSSWELSCKYYILFDGDLRGISLNTKSVERALSDQTNFNKIKKDNKKLKIAREKDVINILKIMEYL